MSDIKGDIVLPDQGYRARLTCSFIGFPSTIIWKYPDTVTDNEKYRFQSMMIRGDPVMHPLEVTSHLIISNVKSKDIGQYHCSGTNNFKSTHGTGSVLLKGKYCKAQTNYSPHFYFALS